MLLGPLCAGLLSNLAPCTHFADDGWSGAEVCPHPRLFQVIFWCQKVPLTKTESCVLASVHLSELGGPLLGRITTREPTFALFISSFCFVLFDVCVTWPLRFHRCLHYQGFSSVLLIPPPYLWEEWFCILKQAELGFGNTDIVKYLLLV